MPNDKMPNDKIVEIFKQLATYYESEKYKSLAFKKAAAIISKLPEIKSIKDVTGVAGIGPSTIEKIDEIIRTGNLEILKNAQEKIDTVNNLLTIRSIGPKSAEKLFDLGVRSIQDLNIPSVYETLNDQQKLGLKYHVDLNKRIPRDDITAFHSYIKKIVPKSWHTDIVGSYRRQMPTSGDIDLLISDNNVVDISPLVNKLIEDQILIDSYGKTKTFMSGLILLNGVARSLDIKSYTKKERPFALLYFTGSGNFNVDMRKHAISKGYKLSDTSLIDKNTGLSIDCKTEECIFKHLGLAYVEPKDRV